MENVNLTIDDIQVTVPKGTNLIEAARLAGIEIPHYCYHQELSISGNCRMCQVQIEGQPKLTIACNTFATEGMKVRTAKTSPEVAEAVRAILEFLLINHPIDCTICDQAGHCKLQDYYKEYNNKPSRFLEEKEHKVKAEELGNEIIYDGERCILCRRCVRFCNEVTKTNELGVFQRGGKSVISTPPNIKLNNPLSGTVADLCPVGALTHKHWRFKSRIWFAKKVSTVCHGCSTCCSADVYTVNNRIVQVKARYNSEINKEWLCNEGRYHFEDVQPKERAKALTGSDDLLKQARLIFDETLGDIAVFISPLLTFAEIEDVINFAHSKLGIYLSSGKIVIQLKRRELQDSEKVLVSPDYSPNARAATLLGLVGKDDANWRETLETRYLALLNKVREKRVGRILVVGDYGIAPQDIDTKLLEGIKNSEVSILISPNSAVYQEAFKVVFPSLTVNEKSGTFINTNLIKQQLNPIFTPPVGALSESEWVKQL